MNNIEDPVKMPIVNECDEKASTNLGTGSSDSSTINLVKAGDGLQNTAGKVVEYSRGFNSVVSTIGLMSVVLIIALDNYIIVNAIPRLSTEFNDLSLVGWYGSSYFLTLTSFQPAFGQLCTLFPIKLVYLLSIAVFEIGSIISGSASTSAAFIIGRLISGAAAGGLWCGTLTLISHTIPLEKRHLYLSAVTSIYGVISAAGSLLGGVFTNSSRLTWRWCFWINIPIGLLAFLIITVFLKPPAPPKIALSLSSKQKLARLDIGGILLLTAALICLLLALMWGGTAFTWSDSRVWGCLLGFGLLIITFVALQVRLKDRATIPIRIIIQRTAAAGCAFTLFLSMAISAHVYYLPFYFQSVLGTSARQSGINTLPYLFSLLIGPIISGSMSQLIGHHLPLMLGGSILTTIGSGLLFTLSPSSTESQWIGYQILTAMGAGLCRQMTFSAVPLMLPADDLATASALVAFSSSLGPTFGIGLEQCIFTNEFKRRTAGMSGTVVTKVMHNGATDLSAIVATPLQGEVKRAFNFAITRAFALSIPCAGAALCCTLIMDWSKVRKK